MTEVRFAASPPSEEASRPARTRRRVSDEDRPVRWRRGALAAVAAVTLAVAVAQTGAGPTGVGEGGRADGSPRGDDRVAPAGTSRAEPRTDVAGTEWGSGPPADAGVPRPAGFRIRWVRPDVVAAPATRISVATAGPGHVLVDGRVVETDGVPTGPGVVWLPPTLRGGVGPAGEWAVAEAGTVLRGTIGAQAVRVRVQGSWTPEGVPVAWWDGAAVFAGTDGRLGLVEQDGEVRYVTDRSVRVAAQRGGTAYGEAGDGDRVLVSLEDGSITPQGPGGVPAVVTDDGLTVTVDGDEVVGDARDGTWRRPVAGAGSDRVWVSADGVVVGGDAGTVLLAPGTGEVRAALDVTDAVPVGGGVVGLEDGVVVMRRWDDVVVWRQGFDEREVVALHHLDDRRTGVELVLPDGGTLVKVVGEGGVTLSTTRAAERTPRSQPTVVGEFDGLVGVVGDELDEIGGLGWIDAADGGDGLAEATVAIDGTRASADWRFVGAVGEPGREQPVKLRHDGDVTIVQVGDLDPVRVRLGGDEVEGVAPVVGRSTLTFPVAGSPEDGLVLVDVETGAVTRVDGVSARTVMGGVQLAVTRAGDGTRRLVALDPASGEDLWRAPMVSSVGVLAQHEPWLVGPLTVGDRELVVEVGVAVLRARSLTDGEVVWTSPTDAPVTAPPVVVGTGGDGGGDGRVVVPLADGTVVTLRGRDGATTTSTPVGHVTALEPTPFGVVVGTVDGRVGWLDRGGLPSETRDVDQRAVVDLVWRSGIVVAVSGTGMVGLEGPESG